MTGVLYATRESVMDALDTKASAYTSGAIDRAIDSGSRAVEALTHRIFYPLTATKSYAYPNVQDEPWTLWLDANELASVTTFVSGGTTLTSGQYYLEPNEYGPPYNRVEINRGTSATLTSGSSTPQRSLALTGVFCGCPVDEETVGTLTAAISTTSATTCTVSAPVGVGSILRIDSERLLVTERSFASSGQTVLTTALTASTANVSILVTDGTQFALREQLLIDSERMLIVDIAGNTLTVKRAVQGSVLAAHNIGAGIYWARTLTVTRGALGTTAATHLISATAYRFLVPPLIEQLSTAYALDRGLQESGGYSRTVGSGDNARGASGRGIRELEDQVKAAHARRTRFRSV